MWNAHMSRINDQGRRNILFYTVFMDSHQLFQGRREDDLGARWVGLITILSIEGRLRKTSDKCVTCLGG